MANNTPSWADMTEEEEPNSDTIAAGENLVDTATEKLSALTTAENGAAASASKPPASGLLGSKTTTKVELDTTGADPNNPLKSEVATFEELNLSPELLKGIFAKGFKEPSRIQGTALPIILQNTPVTNLIAQAQSGTGKTATFTLGMLSRVDPTKPGPQAMCIAPTRELAMQIHTVLQELAHFTTIQSLLVVPEVTLPKKITAHVLVGTPGKFKGLVDSRAIETKNIRILVLDEAEAMLDEQGLKDQSVRLKQKLPRNVQTLLFSATYSAPVMAFAAEFVPQPNVKIRVKLEHLTLPDIHQLKIDCRNDAGRLDVLSKVYAHLSIGQSIIFVNTIKKVQELAAAMERAGHKISVIHGGKEMPPAERDKVMEAFREGKTKVLIATNVLSRGIDVLQVSVVINYDLPMDVRGRPDYSTYIHRIGRTGRFGRKGIAINFEYDEKSRAVMSDIGKFFMKDVIDFPDTKITELDQMLKELQEE